MHDAIRTAKVVFPEPKTGSESYHATITAFSQHAVRTQLRRPVFIDITSQTPAIILASHPVVRLVPPIPTMPTESTPLPSPAFQAAQTIIKCSICGSASAGSTSSSAMARTQAAETSGGGEVVLLHDPIERICGSCFRSAEARELSEGPHAHDDQVNCPDEDVSPRSMLDADLAEAERRLNGMTVGTEVILPDQSAVPRPREMARFTAASPSASFGPSSLPSYPTLPWSTFKPIVSIPEGTTLSGRATPAGCATPKRPASPQPAREVPPPQRTAKGLPARHFAPSPSPPLSPSSKQSAERPYNPLVDLTSARVPNTGRGALYPGSVFKGTQASGRSAYEVEIRILDVSFASSTLSGYLSISHLTDSHPHLTTFFTGEIIGPRYGFITGPRFSATEHDDMRHWGRFEQFRRPSTRADMVRPDLLFRDPQPDRTRGEVKGRERDFVFLRIKERFLVPDHRVRDISGASFAGFYYAMVDLRPSASAEMPPSPSSPKTTIISTAPVVPRRQSAGLIRRQSSVGTSAELAGQTSPAITPAGEARTPSRPRMRRDSSARQSDIKEERREATLRGYYFHSLNQEPFQELFLTHVPQRGGGTFEFR